MLKRIFHLCLVTIIILLMLNLAAAESPYGKMDVYYNEELLPGDKVAKPFLKIGEPFTVRIDITVYQKSDVYVNLAGLGKNNFEIIDGPTSQMGRYSDGDVCEKNSTHVYEWTAIATENWADGSIPLNFHYTILEHGNPDPLVNSGFTVAYCTISTEYYKGKGPSPSSSPSESLPSSNSTSSESTPAFTLLATVFALTLVSFRR